MVRLHNYKNNFSQIHKTLVYTEMYFNDRNNLRQDIGPSLIFCR